MKITLITVCQNVQNSVKDTLESVLNQVYLNYEFIIIYRDSTDKTLDIIREYKKKFKGRLKVICDENSEIYDIINNTIKKSTGDIIGILSPNSILACNNVFKKIIDNIQNSDGIYSNLLVIDKTKKQYYHLFDAPRKMLKKNLWKMPFSTLYLKKEIYEKNNFFDNKYKSASYLDFMYKIIGKNYDIKYINDFFVFSYELNKINQYKEYHSILKKNHILFPIFIDFKYIFYNKITSKLMAMNKKKIDKIIRELGKPKYIQINSVCNGSTGKIMGDIQRKCNQEGYITLSIYGRRKGFKDLNCQKVGGFFSFWFHVFITTFFDMQGEGSYFKTKKIVKILRRENPTILHLHNIHGYYLNYKVLFNYLKNEYNGKILWTFHDCWPFTGHCAHFTLANCKKWQNGCYNCPNKKNYPISLGLDNSKRNYNKKKYFFTGLKDLTIITPSDWLNKLVKKSFLKEYHVITINNTIDKTIFKPTNGDELYKKYNISKNKKILLGVANVWNERKGLKDFEKLSLKISDEYQIVLVGLSKRQIKKIKANMIGIMRTDNQKELAQLYSLSTYFINFTYEDNYPTVNLEAIACGTKVICYDTGGCREQIGECDGYIIPVGDIDSVLKYL